MSINLIHFDSPLKNFAEKNPSEGFAWSEWTGKSFCHFKISWWFNYFFVSCLNNERVFISTLSFCSFSRHKSSSSWSFAFFLFLVVVDCCLFLRWKSIKQETQTLFSQAHQHRQMKSFFVEDERNLVGNLADCFIQLLVGESAILIY